MTELKYKIKFADLIDRLSIDIMKTIFIHENAEEYKAEIKDIMHDMNILIKESKIEFDADMVYNTLIIQLVNRAIWENESKARMGGEEQDILLPFTHSLNGIRNTAKNIISKKLNDRKDYKIDCFAERFLTKKFIKKHGNWGELFKNE